MVTLGLIAVMLGSCIDRINIKMPETDLPIVVDGLITDEPGPYTVQITQASTLDGFLKYRKFLSAKSVTIFDNAGNSEQLKEAEIGVYKTKENGIRGVIGREYAIRIETKDGLVYESVPDKINPVGEIDELNYTLDAFQPIDSPTEYGFRVYVNAHGVPETDNLFRWKFTGTYEINTNPEHHTSYRTPICFSPEGCCPDPRPCSGLILNQIGIIQLESACTCCVCWVNQFQDKPYVSDTRFLSNGMFKNIEVAYIPIEYWPFQVKYRIEVKQMSLSPVAYTYWTAIQAQKEGAASLFQPPTGKLRTNIFEKNGSREAQGLFYASAVSVKQKYLTNADVKGLYLKLFNRNMCNIDRTLETESCVLAYKYSSNKPPADWK